MSESVFTWSRLASNVGLICLAVLENYFQEHLQALCQQPILHYKIVLEWIENAFVSYILPFKDPLSVLESLVVILGTIGAYRAYFARREATVSGSIQSKNDTNYLIIKSHLKNVGVWGINVIPDECYLDIYWYHPVPEAEKVAEHHILQSDLQPDDDSAPQLQTSLPEA